MLFYKLYKDKDGRRVGFLEGNEACTEAAIMAGIRFFAGYPITPSSEIAAGASEKFPMYGGKFIQMEDELSAMACTIGASMAGLKAMTATSGPGFSLKQENLGYGIINEVPCLVVNVQRGGPSTGLPTQIGQEDVMQARWGTHGDHVIIVLSPSSVQETVEVTIQAVNLSEKYRTPVILLMDETIAHMRERVTFPKQEEVTLIDRKPPTVPPSEFKSFDPSTGDVPPFKPYGNDEGYRFHITGLTHDDYGFPTTKVEEVKGMKDRLYRKIYDNLDDIIITKEFGTEDADILLIAFGSTTRSCIGAMDIGREKGLKIGVLQLVTIWPFAERQVAQAVDKVKKAYVVEHNMGQLIFEVERVSNDRSKVKGINKYDGLFIHPNEIIEKIIADK